MSRLRVYVAGSSKELERAEWAMARVGDAGAELTEDWAVHVREAIRASGSANEGLTPARRAELASLDFDGVASAHVVWLLSPETQSTGAWVEMGIAIARGIPVIASGPGSQRCIFGSLVREVMGDMEAAAIVAKMAKERGRCAVDKDVLGVFEDFEEAMTKNDLYPYQSGFGTYFSNDEASIILGEWHRGRDQEREAAIETLRSMLMEHACGLAEGARELRRDGEDTDHLEPRACIAIALALLL